jgi:hypothetical protein
MARLAAPTAPPCLELVGGAYLLTICDAQARPFAYSMRLMEGLDRWGVMLKRMDTGTEHRVAVGMNGRWVCTCRDKEFDKRQCRTRGRGADCKHLEAVRPLLDLVVNLTPKRDEVNDAGRG